MRWIEPFEGRETEDRGTHDANVNHYYRNKRRKKSAYICGKYTVPGNK